MPLGTVLLKRETVLTRHPVYNATYHLHIQPLHLSTSSIPFPVHGPLAAEICLDPRNPFGELQIGQRVRYEWAETEKGKEKMFDVFELEEPIVDTGIRMGSGGKWVWDQRSGRRAAERNGFRVEEKRAAELAEKRVDRAVDKGVKGEGRGEEDEREKTEKMVVEKKAVERRVSGVIDLADMRAIELEKEEKRKGAEFRVLVGTVGGGCLGEEVESSEDEVVRLPWYVVDMSDGED